ncbi:hypothetical protein FGRA07_03909 [Fusarium graminearum]|nr:hypothetical protein FGRA07_03909 [Fusarium graminearum]
MSPSPPGDGRGRVIRWGPVEEYYPYRREGRYPVRRGTAETAERIRVRNGSGSVPRPPPRRSMDDVPLEVYRRRPQRQYRDAVPVQTYTEWEIPAQLPVNDPTGPERQYTESPRPIENEEDGEKEESRRQPSYDRAEFIWRRKSRSRSPIYSHYEAPRHNRYRSHETNSGTSESDNDWYTRRLRADSFSSDDFDPYDKFDFSTQAQSIITESSKGDDSDAEPPESEEHVALAKGGKGGKTRSHLAFIDSSLYTGNAETGSSHTATLNVIHDLKGQKRSLFRWLHVPQDVMNFEDLWVEISRISGLSELEKKAISRLRADVKRNCVKTRTNPKGAKVGYLEPKCIEVSLKSLKHETPTTETVSGSARWICIPYFSLEQYSGLLAATSSSLFPAQTLLQFQYSRNTAARDMEQAVVQLGNAERGECFHISQLWCLIIGNSLIVTCGTMTREDLNGQAIEIKEHPARILTTERQGKILVEYGDSVVWSFGVEECQTWFAFLSKFQTFWPSIPEFWHKDQAITAETWPKTLKLASNNRSAPFKLTMRLGRLPEPPPRAILRPEPHLLPTTHGGKGKAKIDDFAHVLALSAGGLKGFGIQNAGLKFLEVQLNAAESFLTGETTLSERKAYKTCKSATRIECYEYLTGLAGRVEDNGSDTVRRAYQEKVDIFNAADIIYSFFIPLKFNGPMVDKFWGALRALIELPTIDGDFLRPSFDNIAGSLRTSLRYLTQNVFALQNILAHSSKEERSEVELPVEFSKAWLYIVMGMVYSSKDDLKWNSRIKRAEALIEKGSKKLVQGLCQKSLLDKVAVLPLEVLSLIIMGLLQDQVGKSDDICDTYSQYMNSLDNAITSKPSDRSFQHQIDMVQQELKAVNQTLCRQKSLISRLRKSLTAIDTLDIVIGQLEHETALRNAERQHSSNKRHYSETVPPPPTYSHRHDDDCTRTAPINYTQEAPANDYMGLDDDFIFDMASTSKLSPTDAGGLRGLFFLECSRLIEQREFEFRRFSDFSIDLERAITYKMEFTRDRQERAIYAFTLVTIIFLPISAVSSIFGMNTTDVRDMPYSQWLYWAVAIPVTIVVILIGLWFMGELGNITRWLLRRSENGGSGTYSRPAALPQTLETAYWTTAPAQSTTQVAEYSSPYETGHGMRRRVQAQVYYPSAQGRVHRSRTLDMGYSSRH